MATRPLFLTRGIVLLSLAMFVSACATKLDPATAARRDVELQKWNSQVFEACLNDPVVRSVAAYYYPLDRSTFEPVALPPLERDFMIGLADSVRERFDDPEVDQRLRGAVNDAFNAQLEDINSGKYNVLLTRIKKTMYIAITPSERGRSEVLVWIPEHRGKSVAKAVTSALLGMGPEEYNDDISVASPTGAILVPKVKERPKWVPYGAENTTYVFAPPKGKGDPCRGS